METKITLKDNRGKQVTITVIEKNGKKKLVKDGKSMDKCSMSFYFPAWSYYGIYWNTASKQGMINALIELNQ